MTDATLLTSLDLHQDRRRQDLPVVSVLIGEPAGGLALWRQWASRQRRPVLQAPSNQEPEEALRWVLGQWCRQLDSGAAEPRLAGKTEYELHTLLRSRMRAPLPSVAELRALHRLLQGGAQNSEIDTDVPSVDPWRLLLALAALVGSRMLPALAFAAPGDAAALAGLVEGLYRLATAHRDWPIALLMDSESYLSLRRATRFTRALALVEEGAILLDQRMGKGGGSGAQQPGGPSERFAGTVRFLNTLGAAGDGLRGRLESAVAALVASEAEPRSGELAATARSEAERFLFECLQALPETTDLFQLNARLPVKFGNTDLEVDLLARSRMVAVEVDGYYHFRNYDAYRRDRRKDLLLQRHGYIVVRVLATDVVERMPSVVDTIKSTLSHQAGTR